jgi:MoaA/NifB/PqqE/SkfB family radical SAM enzyme
MNLHLNEIKSTIEEKSNSKTFCILPWIHLATRPNGDMRLCCSANASGAGDDHIIGIIKKEDGTPANFGKDLPSSAWNNDYMKSVRQNMVNGNIPKSCSKCFVEESHGVSSKRLWETYQWIERGIDIEKLLLETDSDGSIPEKLVYLDLRLGHTCNLKCIMCSPHDSSKWVKDYKLLYPDLKSEIIKKELNWDRKTFNNAWHERSEFWEEIYQQIPNLKEVYFAGGEPLMIEEHKKFIEEIIRQGYQDQITLRYNSNGTLLDQDIINLWSKFKLVRFGFSIDATEDRNYYIRFPTDWATIENNLEILDNTLPNIEVSIATAIQILNVKHIPDFLKWKVNRNFKKVNLAYRIPDYQIGGGLINAHLLYMPTWLSIQVLPKDDKLEVKERFKELKDWLYSNYTTDERFWSKNPYGWKRWESVISFMESEDHTHLLPSTVEYIEKLDKIRKTNFTETFPELSHLLSSN